MPSGERRAAVQVPTELDGERLDRALASLVEGLSRTRARKIIAVGGVAIGRKPRPTKRCRVASRKVRAGDHVAISWRDDRLSAPSFELDVVYEDARVVVVAKHAGQHAQGTRLGDEGTLTRLLERRYGAGVRMLHRLDQLASGLTLATRDRDATRRLSRLLQEHRIGRSYLAIAQGRPPEGPCELRLRRQGRRMEVTTGSDDGRHARTDFELEESFESAGLSLVRARLYTGRMHQVRVHLAALGTPVFGDPLYGSGPAARLCLHGDRLSFPHPDDGREMLLERPGT